MRETASVSIAPDDINWHDGILVDIRLAGFAEQQQELSLVLDLYATGDVNSQRRRYCCVGTKLSRFLMNGDVARLMENRSAGNIDLMRSHMTADAEILVVCLFGGMIEAEAASFQLTELPS